MLEVCGTMAQQTKPAWPNLPCPGRSCGWGLAQWLSA